MGIRTNKVRLGFIYLSFIGLGSPVLLYLIMAWILEHKHYFKFQAKRKQSIWDLWNYWVAEAMAFWAKSLSIYVWPSK